MKRDRAKWAEILTLSKLSLDTEPKFLNSFIRKIEDPQYLSLDLLFPNAISALEIFSRLGECYLVSLRRNRANLIEEVKRLGLEEHFTEILTGHSENDGYDVKIMLIKDKLDDGDGIIIGDTEADIVTGKSLGLRTVALSSGMRSKQFLASLKPDYLLDSISNVPELIS